MFANTVILLVLVIFAAHLCIKTYYFVQKSAPSASAYERLPEVARRNYAHMTPGDVDEMLNTFNTMRYRYAPWVGYREDVTKSRFVNIDAYGIRANGDTRRDISTIRDAVWFFGGSTTLGWGVTDEETIPAQLEKLIGRPVVNFGVSGFYSAQENLLLNQYLRIGYSPSMAIFLDGINEQCDVVEYQREMKLLFAKAQDGYGWDPREFAKPVIYAYDRVISKLRKLTKIDVDRSESAALVCEDDGKRIELHSIHAQILAERNALCRTYQIECRTFVQPFAGIHGKQEDPNFSQNDRTTMRELFLHLESGWRAAGAVFVTDALDRYQQHAFIDEVHYSAAANKLIAQAIAENLRGKLK